MNIIFAKTRHNYDSYTDFWKLVELSRFETCYVDEVDVRKHSVYVVCPHNGEWNPHIDNHMDEPRNAHLILWCLERPSGAGGVGNYAKSNRMLIYSRRVDEVWVSDRRMAQETMLRFVILGSDYGLGEPGNPDLKQYDFCHMSYMTDRRLRAYNRFNPNLIGPNRWPWDNNPSRDFVLKHSRFALNIHQDEHPFQEPLRFALFAAYGIPILTEEIYDAYPWSEEFCVFNDYGGMMGRLREMLANDYARWHDMGMRARDRMCKDYNFREMVVEAVKESVG